MERDEIRLHLEGEEGRIEARALIHGLGSLLKLLDMAAPENERPDWVISLLSEGSADVAIRPAGVVTQEALEGITRVAEGVDALCRDSGIPDGWDQAMVKLLLEVSEVTRYSGVEGASLQWASRSSVRVDREVRAHAEESVSERRVSLGSVRGRLDRYFHRGNRREIGLVDEAAGTAIAVTFEEDLLERVKAAVEETVIAWGEVRRNERGQKVGLRMEDFEVVRADSAHAAPVEQMVGTLGPDWTNGANSVDWVREQRRDE